VNDIIAFLTDPTNWQGQAGIPNRLFEHIAISGTSVLTAIAIGLPVGLYIGHTGRFANLAINIANIGRAIPSYALLVILLPISLSFWPDPSSGLNVVPTFIAMTVLAIPPILVNAYAGIRDVDGDLVEAGRGMGLRETQILRRIELPIATPVIVGGIRTATLQVIATATIGAILGGGGLGRFIVDGYHNPSDPAQLYVGAFLVALLAIVVDAILALVQRRITPRAIRGDLLREPAAVQPTTLPPREAVA
jgi:osmoprotectant transport system permease protein